VGASKVEAALMVKQRLYKTKEETSSPTVSIEALFLSCIIDAHQRRDVGTCDIPGAFMHADIDEELHILFEGELVDLLIQVEPTFQEYVTHHQGKKMLYASLNQAPYGTVQASLLFWRRLSTFLINSLGFVRNPYDWCVVNRMVNGAQCTIVWYVDDLKVSHESPDVVGEYIGLIRLEFGSKMDLPVQRGKIHEYLGSK
jgi:Reverse transcriptase (RNA-dependent DNA polymerase)